MIRVVFAGPDLDGFPTECEGGNCKLMIPNEKLASRPGR
ncbi:MAG: siderophore-interacting protein [Pseudomonadota bacterium]